MREKLRWTVPIILAVVTGVALVSIVRARRAIEEARADVTRSAIAFDVHPFSASRPAMIDPLPAPPDFRAAQFFHNSLYIAGSGGLWIYDLTGNLQKTYETGLDLPPSPLVAVAVGTVAGDAEPKLWLATANAGILSFDGERFSQIRLQNNGLVRGLGNPTSLLILPTGLLLIGFSEGGVIRYDGATLAPLHPDLRNIPVTVLAGTEGDLWVGTRDRGVMHRQAGTTEIFQDQTGLQDNRVLSIAVFGERAFVGTPVGVTEFQDGKPLRKLADGIFSQSLLAAGNSLFVGTVDAGIVEVRLQNERPQALIPASDLEPRAVRHFMEADGKAFALTAGGLFEREPGAGVWNRRINIPGSRWTDRNISALSVDPDGRLWIGYFDRGIDIAGTDGSLNVTHVEDDQIFCVNRIVQDSYRNMTVVATANGIALFNPQGKILKRIREADGLISNHVSDVAVRADGLAAATAGGVTFLDARGPESIYAFHGLANNHVYTLGLNGSQLMAGTLGGLSVIEDGFVRKSYTTANSQLKQNWITAVVRVNDSWFIGTYGGGVMELDSHGQWSEFPDFPAQIVVNPNAMLVAGNHVLAGTLDRGLFVYNIPDHRWTPMTDGLPSLNVTALAQSSGNLFIGTDNGIIRMPIERLTP
ncbi:MAG TPA: two-component regulator propeller domain-containing protein [Terriglobia bacterium]|jgi:ligand-binding sensor domain-containing protein